MKIISKTSKGIEYLIGLLKVKSKTVTRVIFWKIPHKTQEDEISLKIGRYNKKGFLIEICSPSSDFWSIPT